MSLRIIFPVATACLLVASVTDAQTVTHRWSFNQTGATANGTVIPDAISGAPGVIRGTGAVRTGTALTLPGNTNGNSAPAANAAYFDLPNGIISSKTHLTIEIWATVTASRSWQRLFDFGRMNTAGNGEVAGGETGSPNGSQAQDSLMFSVSRDNNLAQQRCSLRIAGGTEYLTDASVTLATGTRYQFVVVYQAGVGSQAANGGRLTWYRDGVQIGSVDVPLRLSQISDVNNWLGRSQWSNDSNAAIRYDEVRLYDYPLTPAQVAASSTAGPDADFPAPTANADTATLYRGQKVRLPVLANDTGEIARATLAIDQPPQHGTATVTAEGAILYTHAGGDTGDDSFIYRIANTSGQSATATVTIHLSNTLKVANPALNVPDTPPPTNYILENAFGTLGFSAPVSMTSPPGDNRRLFVCEKGGLLRMVPDVTAATPTATTFLDLPTLLSSRGESLETGSECGLLGLAFHPDYATNRFFYLFYSVNKGGQLYQRVARFTTQAGNPNAADPASESVLIEQLDQAGNHNGGDLHFGPDGYLYVSLGDEGNGDDSLNNSQRLDKDFFSAILRIDVDRKPGSLEPNPHPNPAEYPTNPPPDAVKRDSGVARFAIPPDNPFIGATTYNGRPVAAGYVRTEFWATGLRNPWRMSFDPATGKLWCGDVGQNAYEEIDIITRGGNYGWAYREGLHNGPKSGAAPAGFDTTAVKPIYEYDRNTPNLNGNSVSGGRVYRGTRLAALTGKYIFGDYGSGNLWSLDQDGTHCLRLTGEGGIVAFGYDPANQDILVADIDGNRILRLTVSTSTGAFPATLSATGLFADVADLSPAPGLIPYTVNLPFWSDHAVKSRWMIVPDGASQFTWSKDGLWTLPAGTIWVKHFDMEMQRGVPASRKRIETRLIVKNASGAYGVSYRWNEAGTEATLAADGGEDFPLAVTDNGNPAPQTWHIPSRAECMTCHTSQAGHALSFNTRQLNLANDLLGLTGNQLTTLRQQGYFTNDPGSPNLLPRHLRADELAYSEEARVRSYLAVNCSYCHKAGGSAPANWDGRPELTLAATLLIHGAANDNGGDPANRLIVPGAPDHSIVLQRVAATNGFSRMPPLASNVIDTASVALLTSWIQGGLAQRQTYDEWRTSKFGSATSPEGEPAADPDGDGVSNRDEFLAGTGPLDGASRLQPQLSHAAGSLTLTFPLPANRSFRIDTSTDLGAWTPWDIPGNQGLPGNGDPIEITQPINDPARFFRIEVSEN